MALLVGLEEHRAVLWQVFSKVAKQHRTLEITGRRTNKQDLYNFHELVVDALRPGFEEGVRSVVVTAPTKTTYFAEFIDHVQKHHLYLLQSKSQNRATFAQLASSVDHPYNLAELVKTTEFRTLITETTSGEADHIIDTLNERLFGDNGDSVVLYTLGEIENIVYDHKEQGNLRSSYLLLTDKYLAISKEKDRVHRLVQISKNKRVKTRIVKSETPAGQRISQFGGMVFFTMTSQRL